MTIDELIAIMVYKSQNIKAHITPETFCEVVDALQRLKNIEQDHDTDSHI